MSIIICPGIHPPELTQQFLAGMGQLPAQVFVFPADRHPAYSSWHILQFLRSQPEITLEQGIVMIGFSAGVVGAAGAAGLWQGSGGNIKALIAIDGWGVPLFGNFPIYRISHDSFTHWSSALLGSGNESFYAEPPIAHLELWRSPQTAHGWQVCSTDTPPPSSTAWDSLAAHIGANPYKRKYVKTTAACFIKEILSLHQAL
jgi:hypothetical protein